MRHFAKVAEGIDFLPTLHAIQRQPALWNAETLRTTHPGTPHSDVDDIWIRFNDLTRWKETQNPADVIDQHESVWYPAARSTPLIRPLALDLMRRVDGERLGRVIITRLAPGKSIAPHIDSGDHAAYYSRYHVVLQCNPGALFCVGDETVQMRGGEIWWFNNEVEHSVVNNSNDDRIVVIVDVRHSAP